MPKQSEQRSTNVRSPQEEAAKTSARSFYLLEESMYVIGEVGYIRPHADRDELHDRLQSKLTHPDGLINAFLLGESVNIWTVQRGQLVADLDVTQHVSVELPTGTITVHELNQNWQHRQDPGEADLVLDWNGIVTELPALEPPLAAPGDEDLTVRSDGPRPAPEIPSCIDFLLAEEPRMEWAETLDCGRAFTV